VPRVQAQLNGAFTASLTGYDSDFTPVALTPLEFFLSAYAPDGKLVSTTPRGSLDLIEARG
jgi:hypothetical protein